MNGFAWLNELMTWVARWVPRLTLIKRTHEGVLFCRRGRVYRRNPGLHVWWPIIQDLQLVATTRRSMEVAAQLHGQEAVSLVIAWQVRDPFTVLTTLNDVTAYVDDRVQAALARAYASGRRNNEIASHTKHALMQELSARGIDVILVDVAQRGLVFPVKLLQDYAVHEDRAL